jgi:thiol-disulfide isomerase/thioredoxin
MKTFVFSLMIFSLLGLNQTFSQAQTGITFEHGTFEEIKAKAKKENKIVFIDAFTTWCGPCKWMAKTVFPKPDVANFYNTNFINAKIDMEKGEGIEIANKYSVQAYPSLLYIDGNGEMVHRSVGARDEKEFIELGRIALNPDKNLLGLGVKFNADPGNFKNAYSYIYELSESNLPEKKAAFDAYFATQEKADWIKATNWRMLYDFVKSPENPVFINFKENKEAFAQKYSLDSVNKKMQTVYFEAIQNASRSGDNSKWETIKENILSLKLEGGEKIIAYTSINLAADNQDLAFERMSNYVSKFGNKDANQLNEFSWRIYESSTNKTQLVAAEKWALAGTKLEPENPMIADTYAALLFKNNKKAEAKVVAKKAISLGEKVGEEMKETKELLKKIETSLKPNGGKKK